MGNNNNGRRMKSIKTKKKYKNNLVCKQTKRLQQDIRMKHFRSKHNVNNTAVELKSRNTFGISNKIYTLQHFDKWQGIWV